MTDKYKNSEVVTPEVWRQMGLRDDEYKLIVEKLGREPNYTELGLFSVLWSEHCGYKHSKNLLKTLPTEGPYVLVGPGENAGVVDIGDGLAAAFKIESHNHPCAVEPYHGAATGVGGIVRDVLAMGARPAGVAGTVRFGPLSSERNRFLCSQVSAGMMDYLRTLGIPALWLDAFFAEPYSQNPLCNVMCVGLMKVSHIHRGQAAGIGNIVMIAGNPTGRDGIHGCTFASEEIAEALETKPPTVEGDPEVERRLIEACLEMMQSGAIVGIQDMGAAGIASSAAETAARAGTGISIEITKVPVREEGMTPYEILLSETQERMLLIVERGKVEMVKRIADKWGIQASEIGVVTDTGNLEVTENGEKVAQVPAEILTDAPLYDPEYREPTYLLETREFSAKSIPVPSLDEINQILLRLLESPNIVSKDVLLTCSQETSQELETDQAFHNLNPKSLKLEEAGPVWQVSGTDKGLSVVTGVNGRLVYLDPRAGTQWAVWDVLCKVAATGAVPLGISNCLNFGNPENPEIFWQLKESVEGMAEACSELGVPVTGGNVSLYNETGGVSVYPTPTIGAVGVISHVDKAISPGFKQPGHKIGLIGKLSGDEDSICGSEYLERIHGVVAGNVRYPDLNLAKAIIDVLIDCSQKGLLSSAQPGSLGGFGTAIALSCIFGAEGAKGAKINVEPMRWMLDTRHRIDSVLFGECNPLVVVSFDVKCEDAISELCNVKGVPFTVVGEVVPDRFTLDMCVRCGEAKVIDVSYAEMAHAYHGAMPRALGFHDEGTR
ncbi:MAG TPA: phosphoribosylformylglycinamidine synthase subunit PurL [Bacillota bacterium]|nr:phosphoribosylformylglycinamidine synthase subunit PurL [Bacillota bacterium]HQD74348.1 phosphoribosylformylglycinamidine synthase subunit PurL [Bacillota bacterium]